MKKSKFTEEQIAYALRQVEGGSPPADVCRQLGVSEATFYIWKKKYAHLGVSELRKLRSLEDENNRLKRLIADLTLDKHMLAEALRKRSEARPPTRAGRLVSSGLRRRRATGLSAGPLQSCRVVSIIEMIGSGAVAAPNPRARTRPPRFGFLRIWVLLRREGWMVNRKRVRRLYRLEGLQLRTRVRRRKHIALHRGPAPRPNRTRPHV
jgi:putative transposase